MINNGMFSSISEKWRTPKALFDRLNDEFKFEIDLCAEPNTALCDKFFTKDDDALKQKWSGVCWINPPYGNQIAAWMEKAYFESRNPGTVIVCLIPSRTDTDWWHRFVMRSNEIRFIKAD